MKKSIILLKNVKKHYKMSGGTVKALNGVNAEINQGDFVIILGPSGSGKSTIMSMVGALDLATEGKIYLDGTDISKLNESELARVRGKKIGFVFQTFNLIPTLTALENVAIPMMFHKVNRTKRFERAKELLSLVKLSHRMNHLPKELSGGEKQRVAIARALANDPEVILADEPTGNLDSKTGIEIMELFKKLNKNGKTVVLVTHNLNLIKYGNKIIKLKDGKNL